MTKRPAKAGRPGRVRNAGERVPLGLRVTPETKARLDSAAASAGRSQSQQAEFLIEQALRDEDAMARLQREFGGPACYAILTVAGRAMGRAGLNAAAYSDFKGDDWTSDPASYEHAIDAAVIILRAMRPQGKLSSPGSAPIGEIAAQDVLKSPLGKGVRRALRRDNGDV